MYKESVYGSKFYEKTGRRCMPTEAFTYVDPFLGNGKIELPAPEGIAATWFFLKAQTGNTHPAACSPLNMVSAGAYSGAYPTGYGTNALSTYADVPQIYDAPCASGFSHFHQCGPGAIGRYYNYVRVTPLLEGLEQLGRVWPLIDESASPGYYRAILGDTGIEAELTVADKAAFHVYTFPTGARNLMLAVDLSGHLHHRARDPLGLELVGREVHSLERARSLGHVTVAAADAEGPRELAHDVDELSLAHVLGQDLQVRELVGNLGRGPADRE